MTEAKELPELAITAEKLARDRHAVLMNDIAAETLDVMGLLSSDGWRLDFTAGIAFRQVPDISPAGGGATA